MDLIIEIILDYILGGLLELTFGKHSLWLKIPAILILSFIILLVVGGTGWIGIDYILKGHIIGGVLVLILDILLIWGIFVVLKKEKK